MLAIIVFLCGSLGLWIDLYSLFAVALFALYYFGPFKRTKVETVTAFTGLFLALFNFALIVVTRWYLAG